MRTLALLLPWLLAAAPEADKGSRLLEAIHQGDLRAVQSALKAGADPNTRDDLGSTALMHAAAYCSVECMKILIAAGADANAASNAGFTPLMWAVSDPAKVRLLLSNKADVKARAKDGNTAVTLAGQNAWTDSVPILVSAGAANEDGMAPGASAILRMSRDQVLQMRSTGIQPMHLARMTTWMFLPVHMFGGVAEPVRALLDAGADPNAPVQIFTLSLPPLAMSAHYGNIDQMEVLLSRGANPTARGSRGLTPLMVAAMSEHQDPRVIDLLLSKGAEIDAKDDLGRTALDWAMFQGETDTVKQLRAAGGHSLAAAPDAPEPVETARAAGEACERALGLLMPASPQFFKQAGGCISCHSNTLPGMAARRAVAKGLSIDPALVGHPTRAAMATYKPQRENLAVGASSIPGLLANMSYELMALAEEGFPRDFVTDAAALALMRLQRSDGSWTIADGRPPIAGSDIKWTALVVRGIQAYAPPSLRKPSDEAVVRARHYLLEAPARSTQDQAFLVLGLKWSGAPEADVAKHRERLIALQRDNGGWAHLSTMQPDAYATGQALYALDVAGMKASEVTYRRGADFLLRTQLPDGSWFVQSRGLAFQPYQETGFPHGRSQFISAAATSWAVIALAPAVESPKQVAKR